MNTYHNARAINTRIRIHNAIVSELRTRPLTKITIKSICDIACINRSSFYRHYTDIYDAFRDIEKSMESRAGEAFFSAERNGALPFSKKCFETLFQFIWDNFDYYRSLFQNVKNAEVLSFPFEKMNEHNTKPIKAAVNIESQEEMEYRIQYFIGGINSVIRHWVENSCSIFPADLSYFMEKEYFHEVAKIESYYSN